MAEQTPLVVSNPWQALRQFTDARIALGRAGVSIPTAAHLAFQMAHADARDAVHAELDAGALASRLDALTAAAGDSGLAGQACSVLHSAAENRLQYLQRPDLGRRLNAASRQQLAGRAATPLTKPGRAPDLSLVVADGLSALAIERNALPFIAALLARLQADHWSLAPLCVVRQGRVAIGDEVAELLGAKAVVVLIGERPGLSSPDSMGLYMTWMPRVGLTDASRNCISNVRPAGVQTAAAADKLHYLLTRARQVQYSGVDLKDETDGPVLSGA